MASGVGKTTTAVNVAAFLAEDRSLGPSSLGPMGPPLKPLVSLGQRGGP